MTPDSHDEQPKPAHPGWEPLPLEHLPQPNYFPAGMALGTTFIFWGFVTSWVILVVGLGLFAAALAGWISEIRHEERNDSQH